MTSGEKVALVGGGLVVVGGLGYLAYAATRKPEAKAPAPLPAPAPPKPPGTVIATEQEAAEAAAAEAAMQAAADYYTQMAQEAEAYAAGGYAVPQEQEPGPLGTPPEWEIPVPSLDEYELPGGFWGAEDSESAIGLY